MRILSVFVGAVVGALIALQPVQAADKLLNVSYDVSREFYREINEAFIKKKGGTVEIEQSHAGSSKQARAVIDGLQADVVTLNQSTDIDALVKANLVSGDWRKQFPQQSSAYHSVTAFIVRKGNPKQIKDWDDLIRPEVTIALVNPKTGGNGRYTFLAAWGYALKKFSGDEQKAKEFVGKIYGNVPVLDLGGRAASTTFALRGIGDVLITFEAEVELFKRELGGNNFEQVLPSLTVLSDFPFAVVDKVVARNGTGTLAREYLRFIQSEEGQEIAANHFYRPISPTVAAKHAGRFPKVNLIDVETKFGGWKKAQETFFNDGGIFDQIYAAKN